MMASRFFRGAALTLCLASPLAAQDRSSAGHWWCFVTPPEPASVYVTGVWDGDFFMAEVANAYEQEIQTRYGISSRVSCSRANMESSLATIQAGQNSQITAWKGAGRKVVSVSWTFSNATASLPHFCNAVVQTMKDGKRLTTYYHNKIIRIPGATQAKATRAWDDHLKQLRPGAYFPAGAGCILASPDTAAQRKLPEGYIQMYQSQNPEVIKLDWDYLAPSAAAAAATRTTDDAPAFYCEMVGEHNKSWYATPVQAADKAWTWEDYTRAWRLHAARTLKLNPDLFRGACEPGTMKQQLRARAVRQEGFAGRGWTKLVDVDWKYTP